MIQGLSSVLAHFLDLFAFGIALNYRLLLWVLLYNQLLEIGSASPLASAEVSEYASFFASCFCFTSSFGFCFLLPTLCFQHAVFCFQRLRPVYLESFSSIGRTIDVFASDFFMPAAKCFQHSTFCLLLMLYIAFFFCRFAFGSG